SFAPALRCRPCGASPMRLGPAPRSAANSAPSALEALLRRAAASARAASALEGLAVPRAADAVDGVLDIVCDVDQVHVLRRDHAAGEHRLANELEERRPERRAHE